jgi:hypothetical protein
MSKRKREKYAELRIGAIGVLTSLHGCLFAFKADPEGQEGKLNEAVRVMQEFFGRVAKHSLRFLAPKLRESAGGSERKVGERIRIEERAPPQLNQEAIYSYIQREPKYGNVKAAEAPHPATLAHLMRQKAMSDAIEFACLLARPDQESFGAARTS